MQSISWPFPGRARKRLHSANCAYYSAFRKWNRFGASTHEVVGTLGTTHVSRHCARLIFTLSLLRGEQKRQNPPLMGMVINWSAVATIAAPIIALFAGVWINRRFESRAVLVSYFGHVAVFRSLLTESILAFNPTKALRVRFRFSFSVCIQSGSTEWWLR